MATYTLFVDRAHGDEKLVKCEFEAGAAFTASGTDYWTVTLRLRRLKPSGELQSYGSVVGATYSLATRSLSAGKPVLLTPGDFKPVPMRDGEELWVTIASVGSPAVLSSPSLIPDIQPNVR